jgi:hypothetical protein
LDSGLPILACSENSDSIENPKFKIQNGCWWGEAGEIPLLPRNCDGDESRRKPLPGRILDFGLNPTPKSTVGRRGE